MPADEAARVCRRPRVGPAPCRPSARASGLGGAGVYDDDELSEGPPVVVSRCSQAALERFAIGISRSAVASALLISRVYESSRARMSSRVTASSKGRSTDYTAVVRIDTFSGSPGSCYSPGEAGEISIMTSRQEGRHGLVPRAAHRGTTADRQRGANLPSRPAGPREDAGPLVAPLQDHAPEGRRDRRPRSCHRPPLPGRLPPRGPRWAAAVSSPWRGQRDGRLSRADP